MSFPVILEGAEAAWAALPPNKKLALAAKAGMWGEFALERAFPYAKKGYKKTLSQFKKVMRRKASSSAGSNPRKRRKTIMKAARPNPLLRQYGFTRAEGGSNAKTYLSSTSGGVALARNENTLYGVSMTSLPRTSTNDISERQRDVVFLKGINYNMNIVATINDAQLQCNVAVVTPKSGATMSAGGQTSYGDWFRNLNNANTRSLDFNASIETQDKHTLPINTDEWRVLSHDRFLINPVFSPPAGTPYSYANNESAGAQSFAIKSKYIPVNKQVRYNDLNNEPESGIIYLAYWFTELQGSSATTAPVCKIEFKCRGQFTEVCGC